jgi:hypothetical protein
MAGRFAVGMVVPPLRPVRHDADIVPTPPSYHIEAQHGEWLDRAEAV